MSFLFKGHRLGVHLGMTGKTSMQEAGYERAKHDHLLIEMESGWQLVFTDPRMFGRIRYAEGCSPPEWWSDLPPQVLSDQFTFAEIMHFLIGEQKRLQRQCC